MRERCAVGTILKEQYVIVKNLKSGGMGHIDIGYDYATGEYCIVKYPIYLGDSDDQIRVQKILQEANILSMLAHPNIVRYRDAFWQNGVFYLIMEYIDGNPLSTIRGYRSPGINEILAWAGTLSKILYYIHTQGMIYRDLKPSNILLDRYGKIHLIDFGGAQLNTEVSPSQTSASIFTPLYAAPEMVISNRADVRSDIYSLGATIYYLVTGNNPPRVTPEAPFVQFIHENPKISYLVQRAMSYHPESRFTSMLEVLSFLEEGGIPAPWGTPSHYPVSQKEGNPRLILLSEGAIRTYRIYPITKVVVTIGRAPGSGIPSFYQPDIMVSDQFVSLTPKKQYNPWGHARIVTEFDPSTMRHEYYLEDLDSVNGTYHNELEIHQKTRLKDGDIIRLGPHTLFQFKIDLR